MFLQLFPFYAFILLLISATAAPFPGANVCFPANEQKVDLPNISIGDKKPVGNPRVQLHVEDKQVVVDNGILQLTLSKPEGRVIRVQYNSIRNLLEFAKGESNLGGYWDVNWSKNGSSDELHPDILDGSEFEVIVENENQVELSFKTTWNPSSKRNVPMNIDKRFIVLRRSSGFYSYAIFEHKKEWPGFKLLEARIAFKLNKEKFHYMALTDSRQREMPSAEDREHNRSKALAYPEAVRLIRPTDPRLKGEVDDKYQYSIDNKNNRVHGWICSKPPTGFWMIIPSDEFRSGGPLKQDLTSHVGPTTLAMLLSNHYGGDGLNLKISDGEPWKKVFGPVFIYLNSVSERKYVKKMLWTDAKSKMESEVKSWPYSFPASKNFPKAHQRGTLIGRLIVRDRYIRNADWPASWAYIGLAKPGISGSWQKESKGYQFWTQADGNGSFTIRNVRPGVYNLYGWMPGIFGNYKYRGTIKVLPGSIMALADLLYKPPRIGPTLWQIGVPDRSASEFFIPDPKPDYLNKLYVDQEKFRQYGLWETYTDLHPKEDPVFEVGVSVDDRDWFFAHVTRRIGKNSYEPTTRKIRFMLNNLNKNASYTLRIALASAHNSVLQVGVNNPKIVLFSSGLIGKDNAIARHGIHGLYKMFNIGIPSELLWEGSNTIYLTQNKSHVFSGLMYDHIRLEGPNENFSC